MSDEIAASQPPVNRAAPATRHGGPVMTERTRTRIGRGSLTGSLRPRTDAMPGLRGAITVEVETVIKPGSRIFLSGWIREAAGVPFVSLTVETGPGGGRAR